MNLRSPVGAMLWENWRLTRIEASQRLGIAIGGSATVLLLGAGMNVVFWILLVQFGLIYMSIAKLNGGKFMDGYKPGFPLHLLYTRPVATGTFVGVALAYDAITNVVLYLASAAVLMLVFGKPLPLLPMVPLIVFLHLSYLCIQWATRSRVVQWLGSFVTFVPAFFLLKGHAAWPLEVSFSPSQYAAMFIIGAVSIALTIAGVARQRRGEAFMAEPRAAGSGGYPDWLVNVFRFPCPTSSATRAQVWFELKSSGLPALAVGLGLALLIFLLFAASIPVEVVRPMAIASVMLAAPILFVLLGGNAFGIRRRQGRMYASSFELTQPSGTARMVAIKVLVRTACLLIALLVVGASVWASSSMLGAWGSWVTEGGKDAVPGLLKLRREVGDAFAGMTGYSFAAATIIVSVAVAVFVALLAAFAALRARYLRQLRTAGVLLFLHSFVLVVLSLAAKANYVSPVLVGTAFAVTGWTLTAALVFAPTYLFWSGFVERALTKQYAIVAVLVWAAFAGVWLAALKATDVQFAGMPASYAVAHLWPALLPLLASLVAPWSLGRLRHN